MTAAPEWSAPPTFPWPIEKVRESLRLFSRHPEVKGHYFLRAFVAAVMFLFRSLSWNAAWRLAHAVGWLLYKLKVRREVAMINLDIAFGDRKTPAEKEAIYRGSLDNIGRGFVNYVRMPLMTEQFCKEHFEIENESILREAFNRGKGVLCLSGHFGAWDTSVGRLATAGYPMFLVAKQLPNPVFDKTVADLRESMNEGNIKHKDSMPIILETLRRGAGIVMVIDQNMKHEQGVYLNFFGRPASTMRSPAWIVRETGAAVVAGYSRQLAPMRFVITIQEEVPWEPCPGDPDRELLVNNQRQTDAFARMVEKYPELWLWEHRRWKFQPEGWTNPYEKK
jgi:KDO2-lipid IV(A) lauroyltransferase